MKISKFGGSSVADAEQIKKVISIINSDEERKVIVVSAPGKRHAKDIKVTDLLIRLYAMITSSYPVHEIEHQIGKILDRYKQIQDDLEMEVNLIPLFRSKINTYIEQLASNPARLLDALLSIGEDFNAQLIAAYNQQFTETIYLSPVDIGMYVTDEPGNAMILEASYERIASCIPHDKTVVIPGFFGCTEEGQIVTFSRGGSDLTGAILARALKVDLYENFTDVSGIFSANPNIIQFPARIDTMTYDEMRELSYAGFNVFHDEAIAPLYPDRIPVVIKNTNRPEDKGTTIVSSRAAEGVVGVSCDKGFVSINMKKYLMNREIGFTRKLLTILEELHMSYEHMPSGIDNISIIMREHQLSGKEEALLDAIHQQLNVDELSIEKNLAVLMVVGEGMKTAVGTANKATAALTNHHVNIKMINQGSSEISMMFGIDEKEADQALTAVYHAFF